MAISPGLRQKHAAKMIRVIDTLEEQLHSLRKCVAGFDLDGEVIPAIVVEPLEKHVGSILYYTGQANGALTMNDMDTQEGK